MTPQAKVFVKRIVTVGASAARVQGDWETPKKPERRSSRFSVPSYRNFVVDEPTPQQSIKSLPSLRTRSLSELCPPDEFHSKIQIASLSVLDIPILNLRATMPMKWFGYDAGRKTGLSSSEINRTLKKAKWGIIESVMTR
ncbi:hypothetical protein J3R30DRAFT_3684502 [Lentinula aciculospora]|uniref:Uncharacterized protein n=1 Tax=Lentinula aciculospora TaxID=153920 RepID=A0A9W9A4T1_9AGAR|nr:hypothetical protein J3R30DRAFT_3684502 [Lentinula aciculospora]